MRRLVVLTFVSLGGVMQAPGGPEEDPTGGFRHGGWVAPYFDDFLGKVMAEQTAGEFELLLGRKTYDVFAAHWPYADEKTDPFAGQLNRARKYVASRKTRKLDWNNSVLLTGDVAEEVKRLKATDGPEIQVHGRGDLIQTLFKHDLVDEVRLKIFPITLGKGKRLFADGTIPAGFTLRQSAVSPNGVIVATYARAGDVKTGSFEFENPTQAELARRARLRKEG
jgi:dihydrofolate reductase